MAMPMLDRRRVLMGTALALAAGPSLAATDPYAASPWRKVSDAEWKKRLSPLAYSVLRHDDTERAGTSPLDKQYGKGTYVCAGCELPLFSFAWKFDSRTGWPSFYTAYKGALHKTVDFKIGIPRTAYACARCLGHQGHVFDDGPKPTGLRYCNNGVALKFVPAKA